MSAPHRVVVIATGLGNSFISCDLCLGALDIGCRVHIYRSLVAGSDSGHIAGRSDERMPVKVVVDIGHVDEIGELREEFVHKPHEPGDQHGWTRVNIISLTIHNINRKAGDGILAQRSCRGEDSIQHMVEDGIFKTGKVAGKQSDGGGALHGNTKIPTCLFRGGAVRTRTMFLLPGYEIIDKTKSGRSITFFAKVARTTEMPKACPRCGGKTTSNGNVELGFRDVNHGDQTIGVMVKRRRVKCEASGCGAVLVEPLPGIHDSHRMTNRLVSYIEKQSTNRPVQKVAEELGLDEKSVRTIFKKFVDRQLITRNIVTPRKMGIDEVRVGKSVYTFIINNEKSCFVEILPNRKKETVEKFFEQLPDKERVESVTMDAYDPYRKVVKTHLDCRISVDHFHMSALVVHAMEAIRKQVRNSLPKSRRRIMRNDRRLLLSNPGKLTTEERYDVLRLISTSELLQQGYSSFCLFHEIWKQLTRDEALAAFYRWIAEIEDSDCLPGLEGDPSPVAPFFKLALSTMTDWQEEFLNGLLFKENNARAEERAKHIGRIFDSGNGYSFASLRARILLRPSKSALKPRHVMVRSRPPSSAMGLSMNVDWDFGNRSAQVDDTPLDYGEEIADTAQRMSKDWCILSPPE